MEYGFNEMKLMDDVDMPAPTVALAVRRETVSFRSGPASCVGRFLLREPQQGTQPPWPAVILAHGFGGTMDRLLAHAERFASRGLASLVFDYRGFSVC